MLGPRTDVMRGTGPDRPAQPGRGSQRRWPLGAGPWGPLTRGTLEGWPSQRRSMDAKASRRFSGLQLPGRQQGRAASDGLRGLGRHRRPCPGLAVLGARPPCAWSPGHQTAVLLPTQTPSWLGTPAPRCRAFSDRVRTPLSLPKWAVTPSARPLGGLGMPWPPGTLGGGLGPDAQCPGLSGGTLPPGEIPTVRWGSPKLGLPRPLTHQELPGHWRHEHRPGPRGRPAAGGPQSQPSGEGATPGGLPPHIRGDLALPPEGPQRLAPTRAHRIPVGLKVGELGSMALKGGPPGAAGKPTGGDPAAPRPGQLG